MCAIETKRQQTTANANKHTNQHTNKGIGLRFTKGINKAVILGMVDEMLAKKDVNIAWLPDDIERLIYVNTLTLMLQVLDEIVDGMSIQLAGVRGPMMMMMMMMMMMRRQQWW